MDTKKYCNISQASVPPQRPSFGSNANTVLELLCNAYYDHVCTDDTNEIKQAFDDLYQTMTGKTLKEKDEVIYATCRLCSLHQQTGFIDGIHLGLCLSQELNTP